MVSIMDSLSENTFICRRLKRKMPSRIDLCKIMIKILIMVFSISLFMGHRRGSLIELMHPCIRGLHAGNSDKKKVFTENTTPLMY